jgi:hypothetical protein
LLVNMICKGFWSKGSGLISDIFLTSALKCSEVKENLALESRFLRKHF